ncbi:Dot/Icm T4SS effector VipA [Legionella pneumophila]|uniref:Dot/Icm T4SS effector VipA n=1 Tax=Legionella pneumophila TaxID=446 RepID=UPI00026DA56A|nr:Dot/Icm T4SS effector VipA [Legionella pneumophila]PYB50660.1 VipA [Legionella pneumophila]PYB54506.1 VipA [Legionella pneumophila]PYB58051.1 VipA [Legionella pneumophila]TID49917.1 VipA [Legionella pneumophila]TIE45669.1 VipA [Legionella pneumophila]
MKHYDSMDQELITMPISNAFLKLFGEFVDNYARNGTPSFYHWAKEQNHEVINKFFHELLEIIKSNTETFHDVSIIEHLNATVLLSAKTNPYLLDCWISFITKYNAETNSFTPIGVSMHIKVGPEGTPSERIIRELKESLVMTQQAFILAQKANATEVDSLKRQLEQTKQENERLVTQNQFLKDQVRAEKTFADLNPQINNARQQLSALTELIQTLSEITNAKPKIETVSSLSIPAVTENKSELLKQNSCSVAPVSKEVTPAISQEPKKRPVSPPPNDMDGQALSPNIPPKEDVSIKVTIPSIPKPNSTQPVAKNSGFFSGDGFLKELNAKIKERKERPKDESHTTPVEKKNL